jgi:hypothetical protein
MGIWDKVPVSLAKQGILQWHIGPVTVYVRSMLGEIHIAYRYVEDESEVKSTGPVTVEEIPEDLSLSRYVVGDSTDTIRLLPALPDRPVVVSPEFPVKLIPGSRALFYVSIPGWVQVKTGEKSETVLQEIPTRVLSNTWIGDTLAGEAAYALNTRARRELEPGQSMDSNVLCTVTLHNAGSETIDFQNLTIHAENLKIYRGSFQLWSSEVAITFMGALQSPWTDYSKAPGYEADCELISGERVSAQKSMLKKGFGFLRTVSKST